MKWIAIVVALVTGCSISHKSDELACTKQSDCTGGRTCVNNFCVTGIEPDAPMTTDAHGRDGADCPSQCTSCDLAKLTCNIDCSGNNECNTAVMCPVGFSCEIACGDNSCRNGIDCEGGTSCAITCAGAASCRNITCGAGRCNVECSGANSCRGVDCSKSCGCDVSCFGLNSCGDVGATCPPGQFCAQGNGCSSAFPGCDTCKP